MITRSCAPTWKRREFSSRRTRILKSCSACESLFTSYKLAIPQLNATQIRALRPRSLPLPPWRIHLRFIRPQTRSPRRRSRPLRYQAPLLHNVTGSVDIRQRDQGVPGVWVEGQVGSGQHYASRRVRRSKDGVSGREQGGLLMQRQQFVRVDLSLNRSQLAPGHCIILDRGDRFRMVSYWDHSFPSNSEAATNLQTGSEQNQSPRDALDNAINTVRQLLVDSVRSRLRSDVPLAVYLSGGLDSASIAGIATHLLREKDPQAKVDVFTLGFPGITSIRCDDRSLIQTVICRETRVRRRTPGESNGCAYRSDYASCRTNGKRARG